MKYVIVEIWLLEKRQIHLISFQSFTVTVPSSKLPLVTKTTLTVFKSKPYGTIFSRLSLFSKWWTQSVSPSASLRTRICTGDVVSGTTLRTRYGDPYPTCSPPPSVLWVSSLPGCRLWMKALWCSQTCKQNFLVWKRPRSREPGTRSPFTITKHQRIQKFLNESLVFQVILPMYQSR